MSSEKINLLAGVYSVSEPQNPHSLIHSFWRRGSWIVLCFLGEQPLEETQHLLSADFTSG